MKKWIKVYGMTKDNNISLETKNLYLLINISAAAALSLSWIYWAYIAQPEHYYVSMILLGSVTLLVTIWLITYVRDMKRRGLMKSFWRSK